MVHFFESADGRRKVARKQVGTKGEGMWVISAEGRKGTDVVNITSYFITEPGDSWKARDLLFELKDLGDIFEVFIPNKRERSDRRYGIARIINVVDEKILVIKHDSVILEGRKLYANLPKFQRLVNVMDNNKIFINNAVKGVRGHGVKHKS